MKLASHIKRTRHGVYHFRIVIPQFLREQFRNQREISRSLSTKDPAKARAFAYQLTAQYLQKFREMQGIDDMKFRDRRGNIVVVGDTVQRYEMSHTTAGVVYVAKTDGTIEDARAGERAAASANAAAIELTKNAVLLASHASSKEAEGPKLYTAIADYVINNLKYRPENSVSEITKTLEDFLSFHRPHNPTVASITRADCKLFMRYLSDEFVNKNTEEKGLKPPTVKKKLSILSTFFDVAIEDNSLKIVNPAKGLKTLSAHQEEIYEEENAYEKFDDEDLMRIFEPKNFCNPRNVQATLPHRFWMPVLAYVTAARAEEIAQLRQEDFKYDEFLNCWTMSITRDRGATQATSAKNRHSIRTIPLHPILEELGFIDYLTHVKKRWPKQRLFPYLTKGKNGFKKNATRAFAEYLDKLEIKHPKKVFHSFRKTWNLHAKAVRYPNISEEIRTKFMGQKWDTINDTHYGEKPSIEEFKSIIIDRIDFPVLRNPHLKRKISDYLYLEAAMRNSAHI